MPDVQSSNVKLELATSCSERLAAAEKALSTVTTSPRFHRNPSPVPNWILRKAGLTIRRYLNSPATSCVDRASEDAIGALEHAVMLQPICQFAEPMRREWSASISDVADNWFICAVAKQDWPGAEQAL
jgi:hypothetical protein